MASLVSDSAAKLGQFYAVCIGVDNCTNNATLVSGWKHLICGRTIFLKVTKQCREESLDEGGRLQAKS